MTGGSINSGRFSSGAKSGVSAIGVGFIDHLRLGLPLSLGGDREALDDKVKDLIGALVSASGQPRFASPASITRS